MPLPHRSTEPDPDCQRCEGLGYIAKADQLIACPCEDPNDLGVTISLDLHEDDLNDAVGKLATLIDEGEDSDEVPDWYVERVREVWRELGGEEEDGG